MYFLPSVPRYILMAVHLVVGALGLAAIYSGRLLLTDWYRIIAPIMILSVLVVLFYISYVMGLTDGCNHSSYIYWMHCIPCNRRVYGNSLHAFQCDGNDRILEALVVSERRYPEDPLPLSAAPRVYTTSPTTSVTNVEVTHPSNMDPIRALFEAGLSAFPPHLFTFFASMVRYIYRHFRVVDCSRHLGLPISLSCFIFALITGAMQGFALLFIYNPWNYILMGYIGVMTIVGLIAVLTGFRIFTVLYLLTETLSMIPVWVMIGYVSYVLANWDNCTYIINYFICEYTDYEMWLIQQFNQGVLIAGLIVACFSIIFSVITLAGYRKLRLYQAGVTSAVQTGRRNLTPADEVVVESHHHHHVAQPAVITVQQPQVVAVQAPPQPIVVQTTPAVYPQLHTYGTTVIQQNQPATVYY